MTRDTRSAYRRRAADTERMVDAAVAEVRRERDAEWAASKQRVKDREASRRQFTRDEIAGAEFVHDGLSWRKVVRVNAKTVSVVNAHVPEWEPERIHFDKIRAVQGPIEGT